MPSIPQRPSSETLPETKPSFAVTCPHCHGAFKLTARSAYTTGGRAVDGGIITERALTFICPSLDCGQPSTAKSEKFSPTVIATEVEARPRLVTNTPGPFIFATNLNGSITLK